MRVHIKTDLRRKHGTDIHNNGVTIIDPSILDLKWGKTPKEIMEINNPERVEVEALDLISLIGPWVKTENWGSVVEETASQVKAMDKVTLGTTGSCNLLGMAIRTVKLVRVRGQDHSLVGVVD